MDSIEIFFLEQSTLLLLLLLLLFIKFRPSEECFSVDCKRSLFLENGVLDESKGLERRGDLSLDSKL